MPQFSAAFLQNMHDQLGDELPDFLAAMDSLPPISVRFHPKKMENMTAMPFPNHRFDRVAWHTEGVYLYGERPVFTLDPAFHAGAYCVQEASSMFIAEALQQTVDLSKNLIILDVCAASGDKSTLLASLVSPESFVLANETGDNRVEVLTENISKWGLPNVYISNHNSDDFGALADFFDIVLVDAPCSNEGLFRKDQTTIDQWSESAVQAFAAQQKQILANAAQLVRPNGLLLYSTCTYNDFENSQNVQYLIKNFDFQSVRLNISNDIFEKNITETNAKAYQFYPHRVQGEGFFLSVLRKKGENTEGGQNKFLGIQKPILDPSKFVKLNQKQLDIAKKWIENPDQFSFYQKPNGRIFILLKSHEARFAALDRTLQRLSTGLEIGAIKGIDFIPSHELALSLCLNKNTPFIDLDALNARHYLKKLPFDAVSGYKQGWVVARYNGLPLGWCLGDC